MRLYNFRGAGARQRVSEHAVEEEKAWEKKNVFSLDLKTATESLLRTVFGSEDNWDRLERRVSEHCSSL